MEYYDVRDLDLTADEEQGLDALYEEELSPTEIEPDDEEDVALWDDPDAEPPDQPKPDAREKDVFELEQDEIDAQLDVYGEPTDDAENEPWYDSLTQHPLYRSMLEANRHALKKLLIRELKEAAMERIEFAARSMQDYKQVIHFWDQKDASAARTQRSHEELRGDTPLEWNSHLHESSGIDLVFPAWMNDPTVRQLKHGNFLDYLCDCPFEMHDLTAKEYLRKPIQELKPEHKELLFFLYLRLYDPQCVAAVRGQTDRNIRKVRDVMLRRIRRQVYASLLQRRKEGYALTMEEKGFLARFTPEGILRMKKEGA